ncbi:MAG: hypothetical protein EU535_03725 [Promethearchaeota archaeon]|nr:MAG: hypothetical protein EU535_03725 [Candidatus Lokiarchaeota archaeon]
MYEYIDGNGNKYILQNEGKLFIEYVPIKPDLSSSGVYNGGDYIKKVINSQDWDRMILIFNEAIRNKENHIQNRIKESGMILFQEKNKKKTYIIRPNSEVLLKIEQFLQRVINK